MKYWINFISALYEQNKPIQRLTTGRPGPEQTSTETDYRKRPGSEQTNTETDYRKTWTRTNQYRDRLQEDLDQNKPIQRQTTERPGPEQTSTETDHSKTWTRTKPIQRQTTGRPGPEQTSTETNYRKTWTRTNQYRD